MDIILIRLILWVLWCIPGKAHEAATYMLRQERLAREGAKRARRKSAGDSQ